MAGRRHHPCRRIARHFRAGRRGGDGGGRFLQVDQRVRPVALARPDRHDGGKTQQAERAAPLHPIGGVDQPDFAILRLALQRQDHGTDPFVGEQRGQRLAFIGRQLPEFLAQRDARLDRVQPFLGQMAPAPTQGLALDAADDLGVEVGIAMFGIADRHGIALDHRLHHTHGHDTGQVRTARRRGQRQAEPDEVMGGIADHGLIEIADLDFHRAAAIGDRSQIAQMAVAANPDRRSLGHPPGRLRCRQPFVEFRRVAPDIGMGGSRHLQSTSGFENGTTIGRKGHM